MNKRNPRYRPGYRPKYRIETDSLGPVEVPIDAWYGAQTVRALKNFRISQKTAHPALIRAYLRIKGAAARVNQDCQALPPDKTKLISEAVQALLSLPPSQWAEIFPIDPYQAGAGTSQNMNLNEVIANFANIQASPSGKLGDYSPIHPNDDVNRSQSTNDTFPTAMRLALLEVAHEVHDELRALAQTLSRKAENWKDIPKSARTHLQDAVPMRLGQEFEAYARTVAKAATWIELGCDALREIGIGGSAAGTGLNVPSGFSDGMLRELVDLTGEPLRKAPDLCEAMQSQSPTLFYSSMLRLMAVELTRICNDWRLLSSGPMTGLGEILLPPIQPGSSIMPGKINPSILEMTNQVWTSVQGYDQTVALAAQAGQLELNVMMPIMAYASLEASEISARALGALREKCVEGMEPNRPRLLKYFESTPQIATALTPVLGYDSTAKLVQEALQNGRSVIEIVRERKLIPEAQLEFLLGSVLR